MKTTHRHPVLRAAVAVLGDPRERVDALRGIVPYICDAVAFRTKQQGLARDLCVSLQYLYPRLSDRTAEAGTVDGHYFLQDIWAAERVLRAGPARHVDIGSRLDGFVSHLLCVREVEVVDVRPLSIVHPRLSFQRGTIIALPYAEGTIESLSCLHTLEHVGLGRYGDEVEPLGHVLAMAELRRVLAPGGRLYVSVPVGVQRVEFNAHRVLSPASVLEGLSGLTLSSFSAITDEGVLVHDADPLDFATATYSCGLFEFLKEAA